MHMSVRSSIFALISSFILAICVLLVSCCLGSSAYADGSDSSKNEIKSIKITKDSKGSIKVKWAKISNADKYKISYRAKGGSWKSRTSSKPHTHIKLSKIKNGKMYQVRVRAYDKDESIKAEIYKNDKSSKTESSTDSGIWGPWSEKESFYMVGNTPYMGKPQSLKAANSKQKSIVKACKRTRTTRSGRCAEWVTKVYLNAGRGYFDGNARDMYKNYCNSYNKSELKVGMIISVSTHGMSGYAGRKYGHIGIYIGNGKVMHSSGRVHVSDLDKWIKYYGNSVSVKWGFPFNDIT